MTDTQKIQCSSCFVEIPLAREEPGIKHHICSTCLETVSHQEIMKRCADRENDEKK